MYFRVFPCVSAIFYNELPRAAMYFYLSPYVFYMFPRAFMCVFVCLPRASTFLRMVLHACTHFNMLPYTSTCPHSALTKPFTCFHLVFTELSTIQQSSVIVPLTIHLVCPRMHDEFIKSALKELRLPLYTLNGIDANALIQRRKCQEIFIGLPVCY